MGAAKGGSELTPEPEVSIQPEAPRPNPDRVSSAPGVSLQPMPTLTHSNRRGFELLPCRRHRAAAIGAAAIAKPESLVEFIRGFSFPEAPQCVELIDHEVRGVFSQLRMSCRDS